MNRSDVLDRMCEQGMLPVFRTDETHKLIPASHALCQGGVGVIEYTMTMPQAVRLIEQARAELPEAVIGAGTVLDAETARIAILAGAQFIVSPGLAAKVIELCHRYSVAVVPGAVTATEIMQAMELGLDMVKVFPATYLGPLYFSDLLAPFPNVRFMAAAGITLKNAPDYIRAGVHVVTQAAQAMDAEAFANGDYARMTQVARQFVAVVREARRSTR